MYASVIVDITNEKLDRVFEYHVPEELEEGLLIGMEVTIPFGVSNREITGYVIALSESCAFDPDKVKDILGITRGKEQIESKMIALAGWMRQEYGGTMIQALKTVLPIKKSQKAKEEKTVRLLLDREEALETLETYEKKHQLARARLLRALIEDTQIEASLLTKKLHITSPVLKALKEQGVIEISSHQVYRNPVKDRERKQAEVTLNAEQQRAVDTFLIRENAGERGTYLLYGITGSGKTQVYMEMIQSVVAKGKQVIALIPEISLTFQTVMRFYHKFGNRISIMNSRLSDGERYDQMMRAKRGEVDIMIGPRSALFTPFPELGLIVIDEEHEASYKSEQVPRYHAREVAQKRAELSGASLVLGSATPSMEAFYRCETGEYTLLTLTERATRGHLPEIQVADLREELKSGNASILSRVLREKIEERLEKKEQTMLFLNRRGYAGFISCRSCGHVPKCPHCDVALASHKGNRMVCHYCGYEQPMIRECPECGSPFIGTFKAGTQQIEDLVQKEFPQARVLRMDLDTTRQKDGHEKILSAFKDEEADILVGTQMIVKGHDFPNVTLVGILAADLSLYSDDYRSAERTFQLLVQAAGRAGRGDKPGEVVIQTYSPEHYSIDTASRQDYEAFYEREMNFRMLMGYPPAEHMLAVYMTSEEEEILETGAYYLSEFARKLARGSAVQILGPAAPHVGKIKDVYRRIFYIKDERRDVLISLKNRMEKYIEVNHGFDTIKIQFDFNM